ncbi:hypothetical protein EVG20_g11486 [Dentipellis fragilis]|uniref:Uncharacterized protein n=1 Tax=Dentipellis fragilis TaxID=205917 RepID=A0A4Y9XMB4_9AGAM|nr:hypothetical protein EVG20_g11486 [Dentipellis fragilis]
MAGKGDTHDPERREHHSRGVEATGYRRIEPLDSALCGVAAQPDVLLAPHRGARPARQQGPRASMSPMEHGTYGAGGVPDEAPASSLFCARCRRQWTLRVRARDAPRHLEHCRAEPSIHQDDCGLQVSLPAGDPDAVKPFDLRALTDANGLACFLSSPLQASISVVDDCAVGRSLAR